MLKTELATQVARATQLSPRQASECVASFIEHITNALARGEKMSLVGFGSFNLKHVAKRTGLNPQTGEAMTIAAHNTVVFKPSAQLRAQVNQSNTALKNIQTPHSGN